MAGFRKAQPKQAAIKMSMYGPPGSGKTASALLFAEGIAKKTGKRIAFIDTERGTDFYAMPNPARDWHPEPFDFDAIYTRSITDVIKETKLLNPAEHGVIITDSISHLWDAAMNAYTGYRTKAGTIPMNAWGKIKAPYKEYMKFLSDSTFHVFILGRQANVFEEDTDTGESKAAGVKMRAEGETQYEPHICLRMIPQRTHKQGKKNVVQLEQTIAAFAEKDRTGTLEGKLILMPTFENVIAPIWDLLSGTEQASMPSEEAAATQDAESLANAEREKAGTSNELKQRYMARFSLAPSMAELKKIAGELTPKFKAANFTPTDLAEVRNAYLAREGVLTGKQQTQREPGVEEEEAA